MKAQIKELREKQLKIVTEARAQLDSITPETTEERARELEAAFDAAMKEHDKIEERVQRLEKLLAAQENLNEDATPVPGGEARVITAKGEAADYEQVFARWLRHGLNELTPEERSVLRGQGDETRAQGTGTTAGGYTIPKGFSGEVEKRLKLWGPMLDPGITRQLITSMGNQIEWPTMDDTSNKGALLAENTQDAEQDLVFGQKLLDAYKYTSKIIRVSEELLQDSGVDLVGLLADALAERLGRIGNEHITTGTGAAQPNGTVTASSLGFTAAANNAVSFDDLIELVHSIDPMYRAAGNTRFMFRDATLKALRKLKDGNSNYIWQPADASIGAPASILGYPYSINQDVAAIGTVAKSVVFGDFSRYVVRRVREFSMKRLVERYADFYQVGFLGFMRLDGELLDTTAVKHLVHPV
jgi:HK97 family phage major capsid protein